jgi:hypothetical protein
MPFQASFRPVPTSLPAAIPLVLLLSMLPGTAGLSPRAAAADPAAVQTPSKPLSIEATQKLLEQLEEIDEALQEKRNAYNTGLLPRLKEAAANDDKAFALWLEATREIDYEAQGRSATEFSDFRNGKGKELRTSASFTNQLRLQCRFLTLVILQANAHTEEDRVEVVNGAAAYLEDYVASAKKLDGRHEELRRNALDLVIARHLKLDISARRSKGSAAYNPGSISEIYQQMILPYYREKKAVSAISAAWNKRIAHETAMVELLKVPEQLEKFQKERVPELKWGQAKDLFEAGQEEPAAAAMVAIIKANLAHRSTPGWIEELAGLVGKQETVTTPGTGTTPP